MVTVPAAAAVRTTPLLLVAVLFGAVAAFFASQALWPLTALAVVVAVAVLAGGVWMTGRKGNREL
ncbi:hypothetical protein ACFWMR_20620 [Amycolatopsis thailandensis]|uniref:Uncharacterized protein n=1 Tax=Amycolatopsis thailandensis TaxID=589330 RepID=A0A229RM37_9PSEU|nr:hypothetical protein [Amycolatopsis thailandensis]OXM47738.1 hypothetical protein CFP71_34420 [Amycolatopsis thailandensis]